MSDPRRNGYRAVVVQAASVLAVVLVLVLVLANGCGDGAPPQHEWRVLHEDLDGAILGFWGPSTDELFAVGGTRMPDGGDALVLLHDPRGWWRMQPEVPTLWWVHGFGPEDVWAVGEQGSIVHFDGRSWSTVQTGEGYTLFGVWGARPDALWAVGGWVDRSQPGVVLRYDGARWTRLSLPEADGEILFKVWGASADDAYIVGSGGTILHWNGDGWTSMDSGTDQRLLTVRGRDAHDLWTVGGLSQGALLHGDGAGWTRVDPGTSEALMGVWTEPDQPVLVTGFRGLVVVGDRGRWAVQETITEHCLHAAWGDGDGTLLGGGGNLLGSSPSRGTVVATGVLERGPARPFEPR